MSDAEPKTELEIVEEEITAPPAADTAEQRPAKVVDPLLGDEDDEDDDDDDRRIKRDDLDAHPDETPEERRQRNRAKRLVRKQKREEAARRNTVELNFLRKRNEDLERRFSSLEQHAVRQAASTIESEITRAQNQLKMAESVFAKATAAQNGEDAAQALRYRDEARDRLRELEERRSEHAQVAQRPQQQNQGPDPTVLAHARKFASEHDWYSVEGTNEDSLIVNALDMALVREGFDPRTADYWDELRDRARKRLPERFENAPQRLQPRVDPAAERRPRGSPALGSGRDQPAPGKERVTISAERKQAMIDLGVWDDPVLREKMVRNYMKWDKENGKTGR